MNYPIVMETPELTAAFPGIYALPTTFVVGPDLKVMKKHMGQVRPAQIELETRVLAKLPVDAEVEYEADRQADGAGDQRAGHRDSRTGPFGSHARAEDSRAEAAERGAVLLRLRPDYRAVPHQRLDLRRESAARGKVFSRKCGAASRSRGHSVPDVSAGLSSSLSLAFLVASVGILRRTRQPSLDLLDRTCTCFADGLADFSISSFGPRPDALDPGVLIQPADSLHGRLVQRLGLDLGGVPDSADVRERYRALP